MTLLNTCLDILGWLRCLHYLLCDALWMGHEREPLVGIKAWATLLTSKNTFPFSIEIPHKWIIEMRGHESNNKGKVSHSI